MNSPSHVLMTFLSFSILAGCVSTQPYQTEKSFTSVAYSPDEMLLAFANSNEIRILEAADNRHLVTLRALPPETEGADRQLFRHGVGDTMVFLDNDRIASTGMGGLVSVWDLRVNRRLAVADPLPAEDEFASTIEYSAATGQLAIGTSSGSILMLAADRVGTVAPTALTVLDGYVWDLQFSRDGRYLASASLVPDRPVAGGLADSGEDAADRFAREQAGERDGNATDGRVAKTTDSSNVLIWDLETQMELGRLESARQVVRMGLVPGEQALLSAGKEVQIREFLSLQQFEEVRDPSMALQSIGLGAFAAISIVSLAAGVLTPVDFIGQTMLNGGYPIIPTAAFVQHACFRSAAISPDGRTVVSTTWGPSHNVMAAVDREQNKVVEKWTADSYVCDMQFAADGKHLAAATSRGAVLFNTTNWKKTRLKW